MRVILGYVMVAIMAGVLFAFVAAAIGLAPALGVAAGSVFCTWFLVKGITLACGG